MRQYFFLFLLLISFTAIAQEDKLDEIARRVSNIPYPKGAQSFAGKIKGSYKDYSGAIEQKAILGAFDIIRLYYPDNDICVSDSIWDCLWDGDEIDTDTNNLLMANRSAKMYIWLDPVKSDDLTRIFSDHLIGTGQYKYTADFSDPFYGIIRCDVMPVGRRIGIFGSPTIFSWTFRYDTDGNIIQYSMGEACID